MFEWDEKKRKANLKKHGVDFDAVWEFDWGSATIQEDSRSNYGEIRLAAYGMIEGRLHGLIYTVRGNVTRVISLRKANAREKRIYEEETEIFDN